MRGGAERIKASKHIRRDIGVTMPYVCYRDRQVFCICPVAIHAYAFCVLAEVPASCQAVTASPANDMAFAADQFANFDIMDITADFLGCADEFMAYDDRDFDCFL